MIVCVFVFFVSNGSQKTVFTLSTVDGTDFSAYSCNRFSLMLFFESQSFFFHATYDSFIHNHTRRRFFLLATDFQTLFLKRLEGRGFGDLGYARLGTATGQGNFARCAITSESVDPAENPSKEKDFDDKDVRIIMEFSDAAASAIYDVQHITYLLHEYLTGTPNCFTATFMGEPSLKSFFFPL